MNTTTSLVADLIERLAPDLREAYEERAGIREFDGDQPRDLAEALALLDVLRSDPAALLGVSLLQVEFNGSARYVLTTDRSFARQHLTSLDFKVRGLASVPDVLRRYFGEVAVLGRIG